jgi:predicted transcriptional regulator
VWEVVETVRNEEGNAEKAAEYLGISPALVTAALDYYVGYRDEVDQWIERNAAMAEEAEASWRQRRAAFTA